MLTGWVGLMQFHEQVASLQVKYKFGWTPFKQVHEQVETFQVVFICDRKILKRSDNPAQALMASLLLFI